SGWCRHGRRRNRCPKDRSRERSRHGTRPAIRARPNHGGPARRRRTLVRRWGEQGRARKTLPRAGTTAATSDLSATRNAQRGAVTLVAAVDQGRPKFLLIGGRCAAESHG